MQETGIESLKGSIRFCRIADISSRIEVARTLVVTDARVRALFGASFPPCPVAIVPEGERAKSWDALGDLYGQFIAHRVDRSWSVLAIGGGTVSDVAGFAAHTWMRGVKFRIAPTTLLAMTDAALGGKNGIDFHGYKNVVGSFHLPQDVFCDVETLRGLDSTQFASGMAEAIKHAVIDGEDYFAFLEATLRDGLEGEFRGGARRFDHAACPGPALRRIVSESQRIKLDIVERDPRESGERRILNLGHTFGHAVELASGIPHGHAVSIGIALACRYSEVRGTLAYDVRERIERLLSGYGLPVSLSSAASIGASSAAAGNARLEAEIAGALLMDKKREGDFMNLVVPRGIGRVEIEKVPVSDVATFLGGGAS